MLVINERIIEYKNAAIKYKKENDIEKAKEFLKIFKQLELQKEKIEQGELLGIIILI